MEAISPKQAKERHYENAIREGKEGLNYILSSEYCGKPLQYYTGSYYIPDNDDIREKIFEPFIKAGWKIEKFIHKDNGVDRPYYRFSQNDEA